MEDLRALEATIARNLAVRGLAQVTGRLAFKHCGQTIDLAIEPSVYSGAFIVILDGHRKLRHFRARAGAYDWNAIAAFIAETAERRGHAARGMPPPPTAEQQNARLARELASIVNAGPGTPLAIEPSLNAPGRVRVRLSEVELDPVSVMRLVEVVRGAVPADEKRSAADAVSLL